MPLSVEQGLVKAVISFYMALSLSCKILLLLCCFVPATYSLGRCLGVLMCMQRACLKEMSMRTLVLLDCGKKSFAMVCTLHKLAVHFIEPYGICIWINLFRIILQVLFHCFYLVTMTNVYWVVPWVSMLGHYDLLSGDWFLSAPDGTIGLVLNTLCNISGNFYHMLASFCFIFI